MYNSVAYSKYTKLVVVFTLLIEKPIQVFFPHRLVYILFYKLTLFELKNGDFIEK